MCHCLLIDIYYEWAVVFVHRRELLPLCRIYWAASLTLKTVLSFYVVCVNINSLLISIHLIYKFLSPYLAFISSCNVYIVFLLLIASCCTMGFAKLFTNYHLNRFCVRPQPSPITSYPLAGFCTTLEAGMAFVWLWSWLNWVFGWLVGRFSG